MIANAAKANGCRSVAFTYNDPVIFLEYAVDVAQACLELDIRPIAVTAGYVLSEARAEFFQNMDAANVDLKAFSEKFYKKICGGELAAVLETLEYLKHETEVWFELTTLLIPGENDSPQELQAMTEWIVEHLGPDVPLHFSAFHPDWKMRDKANTPHSTLQQARKIALSNGVRYVYLGNVHDKPGSSTYCHQCRELLIGRDWYELSDWNLNEEGHCISCGAECPGFFEKQHGDWGAKRLPVCL
jgi:pyruvate formate lyase activating enzyme